MPIEPPERKGKPRGSWRIIWRPRGRAKPNTLGAPHSARSVDEPDNRSIALSRDHPYRDHVRKVDGTSRYLTAERRKCLIGNQLVILFPDSGNTKPQPGR